MIDNRPLIDIVPAPLLNSASAPAFRRELMAVPPDFDVRLDLSGVMFFGVQGVASILALLSSRVGCPGQVELFDPSPPALRCIAEYNLSEYAKVTVPVRCDA